ncbi:MAG: PDZ domain-containing protein [Chloroflexi bacterium]|nr:PDZ domain-containing protein [Chloroflexota bacterium]
MAVMFAAGFFFRGVLDFPSVMVSASSDTTGYPLLNEVQTLLDQYYLRPQPDHAARQYAAIRGVLSALNDRYTFLIDPPVAQSESDVLAGTYGGIGVQIQRSETGDIVLYPFADGPAFTAGVREGDILKAVNDVVIELSTQQDVIDQMLRGEVKDNNGVEITAIHPDSSEEYTRFIPFAVINVPSVIGRILSEAPSLGYIQIQRFTSRTPEELKTTIEKLQQNERIKGLILDLRNNSGGLLVESIAVASQFLDGGLVVAYERNNNEEKSINAVNGGMQTHLPLAVLINQGTASAAELVAGAIRDHERGVLIGQTTYGKGTVQQIFRLSDDSSLHVTSAEWLTPDRHQLDGEGLQPDYLLIPDPNGRDIELGEAIRILSEQIVDIQS